MTTDQPDDDIIAPTRLVYLGPCDLHGGKEGELWSTEDAAKAAADGNALSRAGSAFGKGKASRAVGGIYEGEALVVDGRVKRISRDLKWRGMVDTEAMAAMALRARGRAEEAKTKRAEEKARRAGPASDLLDDIARIVAKAPSLEREVMLAGFVAEVRRRAIAIKRK